MAEKHFQLDIVTPARTVYSGLVQSFSAPGVLGNFQVLYNHAPLLSSIGIGEVKVVEPDGKKIVFATSGGFVEVKKNTVIMLAESAEQAGEIDRDRAEKAKVRAQERLAKKSDEIDYDRARLALLRSINRLKSTKKM